MKRTLVINQSWEPLVFVDDRKIISLLFRGKVDVVSTWEGNILIPQLSQELPALVRLRKWVKRAPKMPKFRRRVIFTRDDWKCQYCNIKLLPRDATIDHVHPRSQGGKKEWKNCVTACLPCNRWKANNTLERAGMKLIRPIMLPTVVHFWDMKNGQLTWHETWNNIITNHQSRISI